eukprot:gene17847-20326_t
MRFFQILSLAAIATFLSSVWGTQPIDLGLADSYAILAGSTVTSTGTIGTKITGALVGFPPALINGTIHAGTATANDAQTSLVTAFNALAGKPYNVDLTSQNLGGMDLVAGVYKFDIEALLTGVLTLDANGDASAVWVFQTGTFLL